MKDFKIACIGNMNNNMFCLVRYLRDKGYIADLFLVEEFWHFHPESDAYNDDYKKYTHQLHWYETGHWKINPDFIRKDMAGYDFIVACDRAPAYLDKARIKTDLFLPHGGDIFYLAFYEFKHFPPKRWEIGAWYQARRQKMAIRHASYMMYDMTNETGEDFVRRIGIRGKRFFNTPPFIYYTQYFTPEFEKGEVYKTAQEFKKKYDLVIMHQCRHVWKSDTTTLHYKANDVIIKGYADFLKDTPNVKSVLVMFNYGSDVGDSKKLVEELGISQHVVWLEKMSRKDVMRWLSIADIGVGEVGRSWLSYGSAYEMLALKKPFIGRREDELYKAHYPELYPMRSMAAPADLKDILLDYLKNPETFKKMGEEGFKWFTKYAVEKPLENIIEAIENKKTFKN